jgi:hypothetical protein
MCITGMTHGIEDRGEPTDGGNDSEQDGSGAERLPASDIEAGSSECGDAGGQRLPREWVVLGFSRREPSRGRSGGVGHTDSVDGLHSSRLHCIFRRRCGRTRSSPPAGLLSGCRPDSTARSQSSRVRAEHFEMDRSTVIRSCYHTHDRQHPRIWARPGSREFREAILWWGAENQQFERPPKNLVVILVVRRDWYFGISGKIRGRGRRYLRSKCSHR